jgi:hypothetical protein
MAAFHSLPSSQLPSGGSGVSGDIYFATDTKAVYVCAEGYLFPVSGILSGGIQLSAVGPQGPAGPEGAPGIPTCETPESIDLLKEQH